MMLRVGILSVDQRLKTNSLNIKLGLHMIVFKNVGVFSTIKLCKM